MPKLPPPPPRSAQNSSSSPEIVRSSPAAVTTSADTSLSQVRPYFLVRTPMPPPSVSPADTDRRAGAGRQRATGAGQSRIDLHQPGAAAHDHLLAVHAHLGHRAQVDHQRAVGRAVAGVAVATRRGRRSGSGRCGRPRRRPGRPRAACSARPQLVCGCRTAGCTTVSPGRSRSHRAGPGRRAASRAVPPSRVGPAARCWWVAAETVPWRWARTAVRHRTPWPWPAPPPRETPSWRSSYLVRRVRVDQVVGGLASWPLPASPAYNHSPSNSMNMKAW